MKLHHSITSSVSRTAADARSTQARSPMHTSASRNLVRMQRLGLGRQLGAWSNAGAVTGAARSTSALTATAAATDTSAAAGAGPSPASFPSPSGRPRVVVLGGGFGGLYAAVRLDQLMWPKGKKPEITLVDQSERFVFKPLLYELLNGTASLEEVAPPFNQVLAPYSVRFVQSSVSGVHPASPSSDPSSDPSSAPSPSSAAPEPPAAGHVTLADGSSLPYDYLLVGLGSQPNSRGVAGVLDWAVPFNGYDDAIRVKGTLDLLVDSGAGGNVVIVGGGYAGVELAAVVAERLRGRVGPAGALSTLAQEVMAGTAAGAGSSGSDGGGGGGGVVVRLVTPGSDILEGAPAGQREAAHKALADLGVKVLTGARVLALGAPSDDSPALTSLPTACTVTYSLASTASGSSSSPPQPPEQLQMAADLVVWTAGSAPATASPGARQGFPFPTDPRGAIETEPSLRVRGTDSVFALGDGAVAVAPSAPSSSGSPPHEEEAALPATAQVAFQQADYAAWNIWAAINGRPLLPFRYQHLGSMMSLGLVNAAVALPVPVPAPLGDALRTSPLGPLLAAAGVRLGSPAGGAEALTLEGPLAALLRRGAYLYRQPTNEQRLNVASSWLRMGLEAASALTGRR